MDKEVYGWVHYINGSNDDYICAWSAYKDSLTLDSSVSHWQWIMPAKEALEKLNYTNPTMEDLIECLF